MTGTAHVTLPAEREPWTKLRSNERCERCGHRGYCMVNSAKIYCMWPDQDALRRGVDKAGAEYGIYPRTGAAPPTPIRQARDERPDWERPNPATCAYLYTALAELCAHTAGPAAARDADRERFGDYAEGARAISDHFYISPENATAFLARLREEGRIPDARAAGLLDRYDQLVFTRRKVYPWREGNVVRDLRGRAYLPTKGPKVKNLAGSRDERGCAHTFYRGDQLAGATDQRVVLAGGHEKADALNYAGLLAIASNEGQLADAQLAALRAARPALVVIFADGEDPKSDKTLSEGQRLAIAAGERAEAHGLIVAIAEPAHEPGTKADADSILRDQGPEALRTLVRGAVPLAVYRQALGAEPAHAPATLVEELRAQLHLVRQERDDLKERLASWTAALENQPFAKPALAAIGISKVWDKHRVAGDTVTDADGVEWVHVPNWEVARAIGASDDTATARTKELAAARDANGAPLLVKKLVNVRDPDDPTKTQRHQYMTIADPTPPAFLRRVAAYDPQKPEEARHGGRRTIPVPPEVAAQHDPVRRVTTERQDFFSVTDMRPLGSIAGEVITDFWTSTGTALTQEEVQAFALNPHLAASGKVTVNPHLAASRTTDSDGLLKRPSEGKETLNPQDAGSGDGEATWSPWCPVPDCEQRPRLGQRYCEIHLRGQPVRLVSKQPTSPPRARDVPLATKTGLQPCVVCGRSALIVAGAPLLCRQDRDTRAHWQGSQEAAGDD